MYVKENGDICGILSRRHCVVDAIARIWIPVRKKMSEDSTNPNNE